MTNSAFDRADQATAITFKAGRPHVVTSTGGILGRHDPATDQITFLGIPYAEPPLGEYRFRHPVAKQNWHGDLDAGRFGAAGPQLFDPTEGAYGEFTDLPAGDKQARWVGEEDCLTLNIWRRRTGSARKPVMVWIHGGANWLESSRLDTYHGDRLVAAEDILFVSLNYRLGIFGWLDLSDFAGADYRGSHSNGLRDQILALRWIKQNIAAFGGDPANITVMGESAGSIDISWLLAGNHLDGIARRVIMMSGVAGLIGLSGDFNGGLRDGDARARAKEFLDRLGFADMAALRAASTAQIMERFADIADDIEMLAKDSLFWPRISDDFCPVEPLAAARAGRIQGIDVLIGCTSYEMGLWLNWDPSLDQHPAGWAAERLQLFSPAQQAEVTARYAAWFPEETAGVQGMHLLSDSLFLMPTLWFTEALAAQRGRVWLYQFDWMSDPRRRAQHALDQSFLFDKTETDAGRQLAGIATDSDDRARRMELTRQMQARFIAFAVCGNPNTHGAGGPAWPLYDMAERESFVFDTTCRIERNFAGQRRQWWNDHIYLPSQMAGAAS
jgi:para-nitrobenzyl esterase